MPQRNPVVLAKELATLDRLSGGRVELGLGVGWMKEEFEALGVPWERRGARNDEYIAAMRALWAGPHAEFHGEFVDFAPVTCSPRPVQRPSPCSSAATPTPRSIVRCAWPTVTSPAKATPNDSADSSSDYAPQQTSGPRSREHRDQRHVRCTDGRPVAGAQQLAALGVGRAMIPAFFFAGPGGLDRLSEFGERVVLPSRA